MKNSQLLLIQIFLFSLFGCKLNQSNKFNMLEVRNLQINKILEVFVKEESKYENLQNTVIIIKSEKSNNDNILRIGALYKKNIRLYLEEKKDNPFGFFNYKGIIVIVFGENKDLFFLKKSIKKNILFLEKTHKKDIKKNKIPPPPVIYEPIVWIYLYDKGKLELIDKGRFTLLR